MAMAGLRDWERLASVYKERNAQYLHVDHDLAGLER